MPSTSLADARASAFAHALGGWRTVGWGAPRTAAPRPRPDGATGQISLFKALAGGWEEAPEGEDRTLLAS